MTGAVLILSAIIFAPTAGALVLAFIPGNNGNMLRGVSLFFTAVTFVLTLLLIVPVFPGVAFDTAAAQMQDAFSWSWIPSFNIYYFLGVDGISLPLVILTSFISLLAMGASWSITKYVKGYCILFLLLETGMLGVFLALDFFLFYVFWEVMLLPMYFLIGVWGGPRKEYAAIKFFLYTLVGSVLMLIALLILYFNSDLTELADSDAVAFHASSGQQAGVVSWDDLHLHHDVESKLGRAYVHAPREGGENEVTLDAGRREGAALSLTAGREAPRGEPLVVQFRTVSGDQATAIYDEEENSVAVQLPDGGKTAGDAVEAINSSDSLEGILSASLPPGADAAAELLPEGNWSTTQGISLTRSAEQVHTFNILALAAIGQHTQQFDARVRIFQGWPILGWFDGWTWQEWAFILLFIGFLIKVPGVPFHTWLPDAHVEAPTPISMILAGVLLKMGGYGIIRICYPICPDGGYEWMWLVCTIGVVSMVYGAFAAMAQKDFKRLVAYSSVSHMGYVVLGLGVWSVGTVGELNPFNDDYWNMGVKGAMFQMIAHGISSAGMFFMVGVLYDRVHHRNLNEFGGIFGIMPAYTALAIGIFFAGLGLPGLCGFIGEVLVVLSVWNFSQVLAVISAGVVILTAGYILWALQRVYLGPEYKGPHGEKLYPMTVREASIAITLFAFAIILGVFPHHTVLRYMDATVDKQVNELTWWTQHVKLPREAQEEQTAGSQGPVDRTALKQ
jgi:NADH-quinone oxidoreductase subunit M